MSAPARRLPECESYAFGMSTCAVCARTKGELTRYRILHPVYADKAETEILIPSGAQMYHRACFERLGVTPLGRST